MSFLLFVCFLSLFNRQKVESLENKRKQKMSNYNHLFFVKRAINLEKSVKFLGKFVVDVCFCKEVLANFS